MKTGAILVLAAFLSFPSVASSQPAPKFGDPEDLRRTALTVVATAMVAGEVCNAIFNSSVMGAVLSPQGIAPADLSKGGRYNSYFQEQMRKQVASWAENKGGFCDTAHLLFGETGVVVKGLIKK